MLIFLGQNMLIIYIENIWAFWDKTLCMNTWFSLKILINFMNFCCLIYYPKTCPNTCNLCITYVPRDSSFTLIKFVLNFGGWLFVLPSKFMIFWYCILSLCIYNHNYNNRNLSIICCHFSCDIDLSSGISVGSNNVSSILVVVSVLGFFVAALVIFSAILLPTKSVVASAVF